MSTPIRITPAARLLMGYLYRPYTANTVWALLNYAW